MRVNEIFYSLQGEGRWTGTPAVFLRFAGCNLNCPFCDTDFDAFRELSVAEIVEQVSAYPARHIVVTGGEPTLQVNAELLAALKNADFTVHLETNGSVPVDDDCLRLIDWVTVSPKDAPVAISRINELKVVYQGQDMAQYDSLVARTTDNCCLQPCDTHDPVLNAANLAAAIAYVKDNPVWTLSVQLHKLLRIP